MLFFFNDTATTEIYTLSLHDALPISPRRHRTSARRAQALQDRLQLGRSDQPGNAALRSAAALPEPQPVDRALQYRPGGRGRSHCRPGGGVFRYPLRASSPCVPKGIRTPVTAVKSTAPRSHHPGVALQRSTLLGQELLERAERHLGEALKRIILRENLERLLKRSEEH